jgi:DNA-binding PadR family transcriptional regulator
VKIKEKNMRYTLNVNQPKALELGITNLNQAIIFDMLTTASSWAKIITINCNTYFWVSRSSIINELPLLKLKEDTVYRHLKNLDKLGLIEYTKSGAKDCVKISKKGQKYFEKELKKSSEIFPKLVGNQSENRLKSEINPSKLGKNPENHSDSFPTDKYTNLYQDTRISAYMHDWNDFALKNSLNQITSLTDSRKKKLQARLKNGDFKKLFDKALDEIKKSQYLLGAKGWKITFDWLIKNDENILKVVEGNYRDIEQKNSYANSPLNNLPKNYVVEEW